MSHPALGALLVTIATLAVFGCKNESSSAGTAEAPVARPASESEAAKPASNRIEMAVTADGFVPAAAKVKVGEPVTLVVTRKVERTCATDIVIKDYGINRPLPQNQAVEVTFTPTKAGAIRYACAMDMIAGQLTAE
jgi:plastocyanin domain-containing protein